MKKELQRIWDEGSTWSNLDAEQQAALAEMLKSADDSTVSRPYHDNVQRQYRSAKRSLVYGIIGLVLSVVLAVPGFYIYFQQEQTRERLIAEYSADVDGLVAQKHFQSARDLVDQAAAVDASNPMILMKRLWIDLSEAVDRTDTSEPLIARARLALRRLPNSIGLRNNLANLLTLKGQTEEALDLYKESLKLARQAGANEVIGIVSKNIGTLYLDMGNQESAIPFLTDGMTLLCTLNKSENCGPVLYELARLNLQKESYKECDDYLSRIEALTAVDLTTRAASHLVRAECAIPRQQFDVAAANLSRAIDIFGTLENQSGKALATATLAQLRAGQGQCAAARNLSGSARAIAQKARLPVVLGRTIGMSGGIEGACGNKDEEYIFAWMAWQAFIQLKMSDMIEVGLGQVKEFGGKFSETKRARLQEIGKQRLAEYGIRVS